jgi:hypothetical protein
MSIKENCCQGSNTLHRLDTSIQQTEVGGVKQKRTSYKNEKGEREKEKLSLFI